MGASSFGSSPLMSVNFQIAPRQLERERSCQAKETETAQAAPAELLCENEQLGLKEGQKNLFQLQKKSSTSWKLLFSEVLVNTVMRSVHIFNSVSAFISIFFNWT